MAPAYERIGVLMGGRSAEREVSLQSGGAILDALNRRGWNTVGLDVATDPCRQLAEAQVSRAFIALHGRFGEDGCIQGLLESMQIPYTGSGVLASALAMDKVLSKRLFDAAGLPTPRWVFPATLESAAALGLPVVVKPRSEGSSVGMTVARTTESLAQALAGGESMLAEAYIAGHELSVAILGSGAEARVLGTVEIRSADGLYDYAAKYERDDTEYLVPAPLPAAIAGRVCELGLTAHRLLECSGATRVDLRWSGAQDAEPMLLEVNTLPGMTAHSLLPKIAAHAGIDYDDLVEAILGGAGLKA